MNWNSPVTIGMLIAILLAPAILRLAWASIYSDSSDS